MDVRSVTGLHIYYYFGHLCDYQLHRTVNEKKPAITSAGLLLLLEQGRRNEDLYVERLRQRTEVLSLKEPGQSMEERAARTLEAMHKGIPILHNGVLDGGEASAALAAKYGAMGVPLRFRGETDLLIRVDGLPSRFGEWSYRVADVKSSRTSKFPQMMQVAYYDWLLRAVQDVTCGKGEIVVFPNGPEHDPAEELFDLPALEPTLQLFLEERLGDVLGKPQAEVPYHLTRECRRCLWHAHCSERAEQERDLSLVGVRPSQKRVLQLAGIGTVESLAQAQDASLAPLAQTAGDGFLRARSQARALVEQRIVERAPLDVVLGDWLVENERTIANLRTSKALPVFLDLEADAMVGTVFSYGVAVGDHPPQVWGIEATKQEDLAFVRFVEGMEKVQKRSGGRYAIYHFGAVAHRLERLSEQYLRHELKPVLQDAFKHLVDLRPILHRAFYFPSPVTTVHQAAALVAPPAPPPWTLDALNAVLLSAGDEPPVAEERLEEIRAAAVRIGVEPEALLCSDDDLCVVWFRMYLERRHAVWLKMIELLQTERLRLLRAVSLWLMAYEAPPDEGRAHV